VLDEFDPYLRGRLLEVGAGLGTITRKLVDRYPELSIVALEPAENVFADLESYAALTPRVTARRQTLAEYGPDLEWLYSELDYRAGHYRRYSLRRLRALASAAGLEVASGRYFDVLGVLPYLVVYRWSRHADIAGSTLWGYDRVVVPLSRLVQRAVRHPPLGKNVILVAVKL
jgi:hypothetical protein